MNLNGGVARGWQYCRSSVVDDERRQERELTTNNAFKLNMNEVQLENCMQRGATSPHHQGRCCVDNITMVLYNIFR